MAVRPESIDRLRSYLDRLSSFRRLDLLKQVALAGARGDSGAELAIVLEALRPGLEADLRAESGLQFARLIFFRPCERFLVDERGTTKHPGFIHRASLEGLWKWLSFRTEWNNWGERTDRAIAAHLAGDMATAGTLVRGMRADAAAAIHEATEAASRSDLFRQKLTLRVGGQHAYADLPEIAEIFEREAELEALGARVAEIVRAAGGEVDDRAVDALIGVLAEHDDPLTLVLAGLYRELPDPRTLVAVLTTAEETDDGARLANSRLAGCVDILLADLDFTTARIDRAVGLPERLDTLSSELKRFHRIARALHISIDLNRAPAWRAALGERRRVVSVSLSSEIATAPETIMRAVRPPRDEREDAQTGEAVDRALYLARLMVLAKPMRSEIALNSAVIEALRKTDTLLQTLHRATRDRPSAGATPNARRRREALRSIMSILAGTLEDVSENEAEDPAARATAQAV
ncbi:hypothetical protein [Lutibaculum baratangense]|uniref:Uncharacterized protein n=1 Tax=Lutibaculum baratangense AMV1 TaxID=631454 RepID=V4QSR1_9HYPH|nr:hypothetical protein [Lutibaculum baratangense]ESR22812.1 hypothetical protein N177_3949 [Lutibaculum baratangense AMV1]